MSHRPVPETLRQNARKLRREMTDVERKLWAMLRDGKLHGVSFRRQVPIGPYIVDFASHAHRLIIELDGGQHNEAERIAYDCKRDDFLREAGYRVLRFWNFEVTQEFEAVLDRIYNVLIEKDRDLM